MGTFGRRFLHVLRQHGGAEPVAVAFSVVESLDSSLAQSVAVAELVPDGLSFAVAKREPKLQPNSLAVVVPELEPVPVA